MWKIYHYLFGWHYALYRDSATQFIFRVKTLPNGQKFMNKYGGIYQAILNEDGTFKNDSATYEPLTWSFPCK